MKKAIFLWSRFLGHGNGVKKFHYHDLGYGNDFFLKLFS
jgi:hypothetical protein